MTLKIGDRVRIKSYDEIKKTFYRDSNKTNGCNFISEMREFCGKEYIIINIQGKNSDMIISLFTISSYYWVEPWLTSCVHITLPNDLFTLD